MISGKYCIPLTWNSAKLHIPSERKEYLCKVALLDYNCEPVIYGENYIIVNWLGNKWDEEYGEKVVAWAEIPNCAFYLDETELSE